MQTQAIVRSGVVAEISRRLRHMGVPVKPLLSAAGLDSADDVDNPRSALPLAATMRLFDLAAAATGQPDFAIQYTQGFRTQSSGLFGDILRSAATVRAMLQAFVDYYPVYSLPMERDYSEEGGVGRLTWRYPATIGVSHVQYNVFVATALVERIRRTREHTPNWVPLSVKLDHIAPDCPDALRRVFGSRLTFEADVNAISIDTAKLAMPLAKANPSRFALNVDLARRWIEEMRIEADTAAQTQRLIESRLGSEPTDLESLAAALGLSPRALQWRLGRTGTTFERLLSEARRHAAERLLANTDRSLTLISYDLGFSNPSAFTRAAQRWFGKSPREVRNAARRERPVTGK